ncbi:PREDICTED: homeobox-leucine zipper protein ATHB-40-like [Nelumbo nucifera]|uniref:Homeobox-leucine zipper protein n=1 Tax=Nelumbo nucifera TaxID=4432 RepID=A0A1U7Z9F1_NELNU|nr:PREDICTED: homeobox-leucine zipper protein ATHB-40-like [Nelumbo nucifera]
MRTNLMNHQVEDQMLLISQLYPSLCTPQLVPGEGETKPRRRRKKNKGEITDVGTRKRKLSAKQVDLLELNFGSEHKLVSERKDRLASELGLDPRQVAVWFQNRRARWKNKKLEEEYSKLKTAHESVVVEKCRLETEVLKLKDQLSEAEKGIKRLLERSDGVSSGSPSSSFSIDTDQPFLGEFGDQGFENLFYMPENYVQGMEWVNLYL